MRIKRISCKMLLQEIYKRAIETVLKNKKEKIKNRIDLINRGEVPEGYKKVHGYIIPNDWNIVPIKKIARQVKRSVEKPNKSYYRLSVRSHAKGTFHSFVENPETVAMEELFQVKENDLIVNITFAWEHAIAIVKKEDNNLLVSHRFPTYEFNSNASVKFYENIIKLPRIKKMLSDMSPGGAGRNRVLNQTDFYNSLYIPYTNFKEQEKIAKILNCCDKVIELKQKLLVEIINIKKYIVDKILIKNAPKDKVQEVKLKDISRVITKGTTPNRFENHSDIKFIKIESIVNGKIDNSKCSHISRNIHDNELSRSKLQESDILFGIAGALGVSAKVEKKNLPANTNQALAIIRLNDINSIDYVIEVLKSPIMKKYIYINNAGCAQVNLNLEQISNFKFKLPCKFSQILIIKLLKNMNKKIELLTQEIEQYKQLKKALSQLLLTGIVRTVEVDCEN